MSFCATTKCCKQFIWNHREGKKPVLLVKEIAFFSAGDYSLNHIKETFTGIPMTNKSTVQWRGEMAQFIFDNL